MSKTLQTVEEFVQDWMNGHEQGTFIKNQHGQVIYSAGPSSLNLTAFFEILLEDYIVAQRALSAAPTTQQANVLDELEKWVKQNYFINASVSQIDLLTKIQSLKPQP